MKTREGPRDTSLDEGQVEVTFLSENISSRGREQCHIFSEAVQCCVGKREKRQRSSNSITILRLLKRWKLVGVAPNLIGVEPHSREPEIILDHNAKLALRHLARGSAWLYVSFLNNKGVGFA